MKFRKEIDGLTVEGEFLPELRGVQVSVDYKDKNHDVYPVLNQMLTETSRDYPFSYIPEGRREPAARGLLTLEHDPKGQMKLVLNLSKPAEGIFIFPAGDTHPPDPVTNI